MKGSDFKQSNVQGQNRQRGICRRTGLNQGPMSISPPAEPVIGENKTIFTSNLQILKEQAARLTSALQEIETQIKAFEPR